MSKWAPYRKDISNIITEKYLFGNSQILSGCPLSPLSKESKLKSQWSGGSLLLDILCRS